MLKTYHLSDMEIEEFAYAFAYYSYSNGEIGMVPLYPGYPDRSKLVDYIKVIINIANEHNAIYATSEKHEGIVIITDTTRPYPNMIIFKMIFAMIKVLGFRGFISVMKRFQAGGKSIESRYRAEKKNFMQVELLAIREQYQYQGYMKPLMNTAIELAESKHLPLILTTDEALKKDKYEHFGMTLINTRKIEVNSFLYDLERRPS